MGKQDKEIKAVADGIVKLLTTAETWDVDMRRGLHRRPGPANCWECEGTDAYTLTIKINGGALDTQEGILGEIEILAAH